MNLARSTARFTPWQSFPAARRALALSLLALAGCGRGPAPQPVEFPALPPVLAEVPATPVLADADAPGMFERLPQLQSPTRAFVVAPQSPPQAAIVLIHGTWGLDRATRRLGRELAEAGFLVVAPDLLEGLEPTSRLTTNELIKSADGSAMTPVLAAAAERALSDPAVAGKPLGVVGLSTGGVWALEWLESAPRIAAIAFDSAPLARSRPLRLPGVPVLLLYGQESMAFERSTREELERAHQDAGTRLRLQPIAGAGNDLFDEGVAGFSPSGRVAALAELKRFLEQTLARR